jgi:hypothetical protein
VGTISDSGMWDSVRNLVKFGLFLDAQARTMTYVITPAQGATGVQHFRGSVSIDGASTATGGDQDLPLAPFSPADNNPADWSISIQGLSSSQAISALGCQCARVEGLRDRTGWIGSGMADH